MTRKRQTEHMHYVVTCGNCGGRFPMCGLPCMIFCPLCQVKIVFRTDEREV